MAQAIGSEIIDHMNGLREAFDPAVGHRLPVAGHSNRDAGYAALVRRAGDVLLSPEHLDALTDGGWGDMRRYSDARHQLAQRAWSIIVRQNVLQVLYPETNA